MSTDLKYKREVRRRRITAAASLLYYALAMAIVVLTGAPLWLVLVGAAVGLLAIFNLWLQWGEG